MKERRVSGVPIVAATLLLLAGAYVGAYAILSKPVPHVVRVRTSRVGGLEGDAVYRTYREEIGGGVGGSYLEAAFWPLTQLDQKLRPDRWREPDSP